MSEAVALLRFCNKMEEDMFEEGGEEDVGEPKVVINQETSSQVSSGYESIMSLSPATTARSVSPKAMDEVLRNEGIAEMSDGGEGKSRRSEVKLKIKKRGKHFPPLIQLKTKSKSTVDPAPSKVASESEDEESNMPLSQRMSAQKKKKNAVAFRARQSKADFEILNEMKNPKQSTSGPLLRELERMRRQLASPTFVPPLVQRITPKRKVRKPPVKSTSNSTSPPAKKRATRKKVGKLKRDETETNQYESIEGRGSVGLLEILAFDDENDQSESEVLEKRIRLNEVPQNVESGPESLLSTHEGDFLEFGYEVHELVDMPMLEMVTEQQSDENVESDVVVLDRHKMGEGHYYNYPDLEISVTIEPEPTSNLLLDQEESDSDAATTLIQNGLVDTSLVTSVASISLGGWVESDRDVCSPSSVDVNINGSSCGSRKKNKKASSKTKTWKNNAREENTESNGITSVVSELAERADLNLNPVVKMKRIYLYKSNEAGELDITKERVERKRKSSEMLDSGSDNDSKSHLEDFTNVDESAPTSIKRSKSSKRSKMISTPVQTNSKSSVGTTAAAGFVTETDAPATRKSSRMRKIRVKDEWVY